jgi:hypothetical protein
MAPTIALQFPPLGVLFELNYGSKSHILGPVCKALKYTFPDQFLQAISTKFAVLGRSTDRANLYKYILHTTIILLVFHLVLHQTETSVSPLQGDYSIAYSLVLLLTCTLFQTLAQEWRTHFLAGSHSTQILRPGASQRQLTAYANSYLM